MGSFYVHVSSHQGLSLHPSNNDVNFITELKAPLELIGSWEVGIASYKGSTRSPDYLVCCDIIEMSRVGSDEFPVLRYILESTKKNLREYSPIQYIRLNRQRIERICISLIHSDGTPVTSKPDTDTVFSLHFRQPL